MSTDDRCTLPRWRANMDAKDLRRYVMRAVKAAERIMYDAYDRGDEDMSLKACTRLTQAAQTYLKVLEADELEERLEAVEKALENQSTFSARRN
ncbi:hypothetical protein CRI94_17350 [Longibacter salinarum]|uniref:Uncharacterized protein n=1 Tax=Longibacter salinarum TaxID=1850348 RepID=A0A2A8CTI9_9BACT|nr:hypothetical protein [Longibacter salinarum]PEN10383.1 hypothetical protein CRI94_17350 [Longibacter salinarum]